MTFITIIDTITGADKNYGIHYIGQNCIHKFKPAKFNFYHKIRKGWYEAINDNASNQQKQVKICRE